MTSIRIRDDDSVDTDLRSSVAAPYSYKDLDSDMSFRVAELLPGNRDDPISCRLHAEEWERNPQYDAISYAWGDPHDRTTIMCDGRRLRVTKTLHSALVHFRRKDRSRIMWADGLCINQENIPERGLQVKQMKTIYTRAQHVLVWLGPDEHQQAEAAIHSVHVVSDFLCKQLDISIWQHKRNHDTYQEIILKRKDQLPLPDQAGFDAEVDWKSLAWLYSRQYFTRVWAIQEVNASSRCAVHVGDYATAWNCIDLVACYMIMDSTFSDRHGFSKAHCWYVASFAELVNEPKRWLNMLYLASNFGCLDARDVIYGLRGLMGIQEGESLLFPDYHKDTEEVYRDCVEAALTNFKTTDVLLYATGNETPSWIPRWDSPMLFRNPFRFGKPVPWRPADETTADWLLDKRTNVLSVSGHKVGTLRVSRTYNQLWFADSTLHSIDQRAELQGSWTAILQLLGDSQQTPVLSLARLTAAAHSLAFGMSSELNTSEKDDLTLQFIAYLSSVFAEASDTLLQYIPEDLLHEAGASNGRLFGKPVWNFQYPDASIFVAQDNQLIGCANATTEPGDVIFIACGSSYPFILRPVKIAGRPTRYKIRGFSYIHGIMHGADTTHEVSYFHLC